MNKDKLIQTSLFQSEACDTCKFTGNCDDAPLTKNNSCPAKNGQHYPCDNEQLKDDYTMY